MKIRSGLFVCNKKLLIERVCCNVDRYKYGSIIYYSVTILQGPVMQWMQHVHPVPMHLSLHIKPSAVDIVTLPLWAAPNLLFTLT